MAKPRTVHRCSECGAAATGWLGRCPQCGGWGTLVAEALAAGRATTAAELPVGTDAPVPIAEVDKWTDLDPDEQRAIALLGAGVSVELCDRVALLTLARLGLVRGGQLTPAADQLRRAAILHELAA